MRYPDSNRMMVDGSIKFRRFAYLHKRNPEQFGLLEATGYQDALRHLGSSFYIRQIWLTTKEDRSQSYDHEAKRRILSRKFPFLATVTEMPKPAEILNCVSVSTHKEQK